MARTKKYVSQIRNKIAYINRKARAVEKTFGRDSEQYQRYINATTAALPAGSYKLTETGRISIPLTKENVQTLKTGQLAALTKLPTAEHSMEIAKQAAAKNALRAAGVAQPTQEQIKAEAVSMSDIAVLEELEAKAFIQGLENTKGKLKYSESVRAEFERSGNKTYKELADAIRKGQKIDVQKQRKADYQRQYRAERREEVNRKQREYRARNREEVNRKQREYRARRKIVSG